MQGARRVIAALWGGQGQEALMPEIMQRSLGVTTSGHLSNRQVIRRSQPQFSIIRASCITLPGSKGKRPFQDLGQISAPLYLIVDKHDSLTQSGWCRQGLYRCRRASRQMIRLVPGILRHPFWHCECKVHGVPAHPFRSDSNRFLCRVAIALLMRLHWTIMRLLSCVVEYPNNTTISLREEALERSDPLWL